MFHLRRWLLSRPRGWLSDPFPNWKKAHFATRVDPGGWAACGRAVIAVSVADVLVQRRRLRRRLCFFLSCWIGGRTEHGAAGEDSRSAAFIAPSWISLTTGPRVTQHSALSFPSIRARKIFAAARILERDHVALPSRSLAPARAREVEPRLRWRSRPPGRRAAPETARSGRSGTPAVPARTARRGMRPTTSSRLRAMSLRKGKSS